MGGARNFPLIVCWGELLWDRFPDGRRLGGAPANVAYHAAALGDRAALVSRVGRDPLGDEAIAELAKHRVDTRCVQRDDLPTGIVDVAVIDGEPHFSISAPAAWDRIVVDAAVERLLSQADAFCYGTLSQRAAPSGRAALRRALSCLPKRCLKVCDVNLRPPFDDEEIARTAVAFADVIKLNVREAEQIGIENVAGKIVAITRGRGGSAIRDDTETHAAAGIPIDEAAGDRVGAGDAFTAALIHGLVRGARIDLANDRANRYAAFVASQAGAMPAIPPRVRAAV